MKEIQPKIFHLNIIEKDKQMIEQKKVEILLTERICNKAKSLTKNKKENKRTIILLTEITEKVINMVQMNGTEKIITMKGVEEMVKVMKQTYQKEMKLIIKPTDILKIGQKIQEILEINITKVMKERNFNLIIKMMWTEMKKITMSNMIENKINMQKLIIKI